MNQPGVWYSHPHDVRMHGPYPRDAPPSFHRTHLGARLEEQANAGRAAALGKGTAREEAKGQERTAGEHGLFGGVLERTGLSWLALKELHGVCVVCVG